MVLLFCFGICGTMMILQVFFPCIDFIYSREQLYRLFYKYELNRSSAVVYMQASLHIIYLYVCSPFAFDFTHHSASFAASVSSFLTNPMDFAKLR